VRRPWVVLAASLALAGCDGSGDGKRRAVTVPAGSPVRVSAREYSFDPSAIAIEGDGNVRITLRNAGDLAHDLRIERGGHDLGGTPSFQGGERSARLRLGPGRYRFFCSVGDHEQLGMRGSLRVR
jgi:plastocyanin